MSDGTRTVAITGATGFLGAHLARAFLDAGWSVRAVVRRPTAGAFLNRWGARCIRADLLEPDALAEAVQGVDVVVSNAALYTLRRAAWDDFARPNLTGTENVLRAAAAAGVGRVLQVSSTAVYRHRLGRVLDERAPELDRRDRGRVRHYAVSKALSDRLAVRLSQELGLDLVRLRPCAIYGSGDRVLGPVVERWLRRVPTAVVPDVGWPLVHAGDVAAAAVVAAMADGAVGRSFNLADPPVAVSRILRVWRDARGWSWPRPIVGVPVPLSVAYDTTAARRVLGFRSRPLAEGVAEAVGPAPAAW